MKETKKAAIVRKAVDPKWLTWMVIYPCDRNTEWFASEYAANEAAREYNEA